MLFDSMQQSIPDQPLVLDHAQPELTIRRLDLIHPQISGNKFFKLKYNILHAQQSGFQGLITFGGAHSNHIAATAYAAHAAGLQSTGVIRGEELATKALNPTLATARQFGMQLHFVSREQYRHRTQPEFLQQLAVMFPDHYLLPEGGTNQLAVQGCMEILSAQDRSDYDIICCAVGTGGTISGLIEASGTHQQVLGFSALKGNFLTQDIRHYTARTNWSITADYCFGGYARTTPQLLTFIQNFQQRHQIPLEPIYTGKMLYGIHDLIDRQYFPEQSRILVIHSGGLQGWPVPTPD
ncbi:1-aminocyclopropane-1-carboxylate deaminase/D-cysteine desulfhydrase [Acinetobacter sp. WZC-1]|uniref:1-aminocyclopropane-1-carboxylate deaminase/D-cysteine desulfhydrase n=1 Tax=Acinetobacter sp. WZC-1 TaxID=3459034 RepID=UPI00403E1158